MKYFTIKELEKSSTADKLKIDNKIPINKIPNAQYLIEKVLDVIREEYGKPIYVNSGYRCLQLNTALKGAKNSQHMMENDSAAADIDTRKGKGENLKLFNLIIELCKTHKLEFDQLIDESGLTWIHISVKIKGKNRKEIKKL